MTGFTVFKGSGARIKKLREQSGRTAREMARVLGLSMTAYYKNESGETFPGGATISFLEKEYDISMDWLVFGKGPMCYNEERQRVESMEKELAALKEEHEKVLAAKKKREKEMENKLVVEDNPGLKELFEYMERVPLLYHEIMVYFEKFKAGAGNEAAPVPQPMRVDETDPS